MTNRIKVWRYIQGLTSETKEFAFEVNNILGFESDHLDGLLAKIGPL